MSDKQEMLKDLLSQLDEGDGSVLPVLNDLLEDMGEDKAAFRVRKIMDDKLPASLRKILMDRLLLQFSWRIQRRKQVLR